MSASTPAKDGVTTPSLVNWEILKNKYNSSTSDASAFSITDASNGYISYSGDHLASAIETPLANIIKCSITWENKLYYGTIPITTAWTLSDNYRVKLKDYTGFRYAIYSSDGMTPEYDSAHPFEFTCLEKINYVWEDVSTVAGDHAISYVISAVGNYLSTKDGSATNSNLLKILTSSTYRDGCEKNQWWGRPASRYDGVCVNEAICCIYRQGETIVGRINVPIHYLLNKYGLANINEWDGNSVQLDDEGGFILAPQMGAGHKESDNSFTGVLMGEVRPPSKETSQIGLLGYSSGERSFFLNSKNGSALFGNSNQAQIVIDPSPSQQKALIYSGNFWESYNDDGDYAGLPTSYTYRNDYYKPSGNAKKDANGNIVGAGMIIDLTTPEIYFGTGNFYVTKDGYLHAAGGGDIGGWKIGTEEITDSAGNTATHSMLYTNVTKGNGRITLDAGTINEETGRVVGPGKIYSHSHDELTKTGKGFYLAYDGLSIGNKAKLTNEGIMYIGKGAVAKGGTESGKFWTINGDDTRAYISYGGSVSFAAATDDDGDTAKVYLGTDGISIGSRFSINDKGELTSYSGEIGSWVISKTQLKSATNNIILNSNGSMEGGSDDYTWSIKTSGKATFNYLTANKGGEVGGWTIGSTYLRGGTLTLNNNGSISGSNWSVSSDGLANFTKIYGSVASSYSFVGGGTTLSGGSGGSTALPGANTDGTDRVTVGGTGLKTYIKNLVVDSLNVTTSFTFNGHSVQWQLVRCIVKRKMNWNTYTIAPVASIELSEGKVTSYTCYTAMGLAGDLSSTSWYRDLYLLVGKGDMTEGSGED